MTRLFTYLLFLVVAANAVAQVNVAGKVIDKERTINMNKDELS